jgi:hypothetical protein
MKIRFNMEIRGCRWPVKEMKDWAICPFMETAFGECNATFPDKPRTLPQKLNPSWCPMIKEGK